MGAGASIPNSQCSFTQLPQIPVNQNQRPAVIPRSQLQLKLSITTTSTTITQKDLPTSKGAPSSFYDPPSRGQPESSTESAESTELNIAESNRKWYTKCSPTTLNLIDQLPSAESSSRVLNNVSSETMLLIQKIAASMGIAQGEELRVFLSETDIPKIQCLHSSSITYLETPRDHSHSVQPELTLSALSTYFELLNATSTTPATKRAILKKVCSILNENEDDKDNILFCEKTRIREVAFAGHELKWCNRIEYLRQEQDEKIHDLFNVYTQNKLDPVGKRAILKQILRDTRGQFLSTPVKKEIVSLGLKSSLSSPPNEIDDKKRPSDQLLVPGCTLVVLIGLLQGNKTDLSPVEERAVLKELWQVIHGGSGAKQFCRFVYSSSIYLIFRSAVRCGLLHWCKSVKEYNVDANVLRSVSFADISVGWTPRV